jgi:hypothetical protein
MSWTSNARIASRRSGATPNPIAAQIKRPAPEKQIRAGLTHGGAGRSVHGGCLRCSRGTPNPERGDAGKPTVRKRTER